MVRDYRKLEHRISYQFENSGLLKNALTHRSVGSTNNERLEFLGDAVLSFVVANAIYHRYPQVTEGELTRLRAYLVKGQTLAKLAKDLELGQYLILGQGELSSGGHRRDSILADGFEALIAAIFLDGGLAPATDLLLSCYAEFFEDEAIFSKLKDAKTHLQEYLQARKYPLPTYELKQIEGAQHKQKFYVGCVVKGIDIQTQGEGTSRRKAEQHAAELYLAKLTQK